MVCAYVIDSPRHRLDADVDLEFLFEMQRRLKVHGQRHARVGDVPSRGEIVRPASRHSACSASSMYLTIQLKCTTPAMSVSAKLHAAAGSDTQTQARADLVILAVTHEGVKA
jgi:hypothetical protein